MFQTRKTRKMSRQLHITQAIAECMDDIEATRIFFGEETQVSKLIEEGEELKPCLNQFLNMRAAGMTVKLNHHTTASELSDFIAVALGLLLLDEGLDEATAEFFRSKNRRTRKRIANGEYGPDGKWLG